MNKQTEQIYLTILIMLIDFEPAYFRYDHDQERASEKHPEYHVDFNYSQGATFKIGLKEAMSCDEILDLTDINNTNQYYIQV